MSDEKVDFDTVMEFAREWDADVKKFCSDLEALVRRAEILDARYHLIRTLAISVLSDQ